MAYLFEIDGDYVNFNGGGNLWRLHKNSRCVAWHWDETGDLFFDVYDQCYVVKAANIGTVTIGGVALSTAADFETNIKIVFPGLAGGGSTGYLSSTFELTDAQIKALPTTPIQIVAAPGANKIINILGGNAVLNWNADYTNIDGSAYMAMICNNGGLASHRFAPSDMLALGESTLTSISPYTYTAGSFILDMTNALAEFNNKSLKLFASNGVAGNFTGGNEANTLKVTVYYVVVDL